MTCRPARLAALCAIAAALPACEASRERPGPPRIGLTFDRDSVRSPDTLTGSMRADDPDGLDSIWLTIDAGPPLGADGLLKSAFLASFRAEVRAGRSAGDHLPVLLKARDVSGLVGELDTFVTVTGP